MDITLNSTLRENLRTRPIAIRALEGDSSHECWEHLDLSLAAFCEKLGLDSKSLLFRATHLGPVNLYLTFEARLVHHADLESNIPFPMAGRLEQQLYQNAAPGIFRYSGKGGVEPGRSIPRITLLRN